MPFLFENDGTTITLAGPVAGLAGSESLVLVWEHGGSGEGDDGNMYAGLIDTRWCTGKSDSHVA